MKHGSIALLVIAGCFVGTFVGCLYGDPDYSQTSFSCDADHACPDGQSCSNGTCAGGGSGPGVACGAGGTCTTGQKCCFEAGSAPLCIPVGDPCAGDSATCDQASDCGADRCCNTNDDGPECVSGACAMDACVTDDDCPAGARHCCPFNPFLPWHYCYSIECSF